MKYFCSSCQKRYDVGDIAADLYDICVDEDFSDKLIDLIPNTDDNIAGVISRFYHNDPQARKCFAVKGSEIKHHITNPSIQGHTIRGHFTITLGWLINAFKESDAYKALKESAKTSLDAIPENVTNNVLFDEEMVFYFGEIGNKELVLDHITDSKNDPFSVTDEDNKATKEIRGYRRVCPHCGKRLSRAVGRAPEIVVCLAGAGRAGKTTSLVAISSALSAGTYAKYGLSMEHLLYDEQWNRIEKQIELFNRGIRVEKTDLNQQEAPSHSILVQMGDTSTKIIKRVVTFVDMPGEFFGSESSGLSKEFFTQYSNLLSNIDFLWLFISKLTAYEFDLGSDENQTDEQKRLADEANDKTAIMKTSNSEHLSANLTAIKDYLISKGRKMPPTVVALTKTEVDAEDIENIAKYSLFPTENGKISANVNSVNTQELKKTFVADKSGRYLLEEMYFFNKALKVRNFFVNQCGGMVSAIESSCPYRFYVAMAAYGHPAASIDNKEEGYSPTPYHEMYPLLWTLAMAAAVPIKHICRWSEKGFFGTYKAPVEGSTMVMFDAPGYIYKAKPAGKLTEEQEDRQQFDKDIASNMLMEGVVQNKLSYKSTNLLHKQR